jgi:DNA invertase Pin-like site-specific DNA recombinase
MDRPALIRLLQDIRAGRVDTIVVYKIDRLTRSLADFARIVDVLDSCSASFVSVTQSFNTQTSMGRLTLNVLLSFAQFERELTGERIRDKIAASKARGMWMGGVVPIGYDVSDRKLVVNDAEAETVRNIYARYLILGSVVSLQAELHRQHITGKRRPLQGDDAAGGSLFSRGALYLLLQNRLYRGEICHKGTPYPGEHVAIVPADLFDQVQAQLERNRIDRSNITHAGHPSLLTGLISDTHGRPMAPNHSVKGKLKRYRYYASRKGVSDDVPAWRVPAGDLEELIIGSLRSFLHDSRAIFDAAGLESADATMVQRTLNTCSALAEGLSSHDVTARQSALSRTIERVIVHQDRIELGVSVRNDAAMAATPHGASAIKTDLQIPARLARIGKQVRLIVSRGAQPKPDPALVKLVAKSWQARAALERGDMTVAELGRSLSYDRQYLGVLVRISYLAPAIIKAILAGEQPQALTRQQLARVSNLPTEWSAQWHCLGFVAETP